MTVYTADEIRQHRQLTLDSLRRTGPEHFDMGAWFATAETALDIEDVGDIDLGACGTTACFGGHAAYAWAASDPGGYSADVSDIYAWLDLPLSEWSDEPQPMFFSVDWPEELLREVDRLHDAGMTNNEAEWNVLVLWLSHEIEPSTKVPWNED